jgi:Zn-finger nucleic acid-binding protein
MCETCRETWFDEGELAVYLGKPNDLPPCSKPHPGPINKPILKCPVCSSADLLPWIADHIELLRCQGCKGILIALSEAKKLKKLFPLSRGKPAQIQNAGVHAGDPFLVESPHLDVFAVPVALLVGIFLSFFHGYRLIAWYVGMIFHELGHAVAAWLGGILAIPTPFAVTITMGRSIVFAIFFLIVWILGFIGSFNMRSRILQVMFLTLIALQIKMSFFMTNEKATEIHIAAGAGGEIAFAAVLLGAFRYRLPRRLRWDFWRLPALIIGTFLFTDAIILWVKIKMGRAMIPWGSAVNQSNDGDMNRLCDVYGWTEPEIIQTFYMLSLMALGWILLNYILGLIINLRIKRGR